MSHAELLGIFVPIGFFALWAIEKSNSARAFPRPHKWAVTGLSFFAMVLILGSITPIVLRTFFENSKAHQLSEMVQFLDLSQKNQTIAFVIGLLVSSFVSYWLHRAQHAINWLWRASHQLHHSAIRIDILGAFYTHPVEVILKVSISFFIGTWLLNLPATTAAAIGLTSAMLSMFQHLNSTTPFWLGYIVARPESHVLHHQKHVHARNYSELPIWDMLFGTFVNPRQAQLVDIEVGFTCSDTARISEMLSMRDVHVKSSSR